MRSFPRLSSRGLSAEQVVGSSAGIHFSIRAAVYRRPWLSSIALFQDVRVDHRRADVSMSQQLLNRADVVTVAVV